MKVLLCVSRGCGQRDDGVWVWSLWRHSSTCCGDLRKIPAAAARSPHFPLSALWPNDLFCFGAFRSWCGRPQAQWKGQPPKCLMQPNSQRPWRAAGVLCKWCAHELPLGWPLLTPSPIPTPTTTCFLLLLAEAWFSARGQVLLSFRAPSPSDIAASKTTCFHSTH